MLRCGGGGIDCAAGEEEETQILEFSVGETIDLSGVLWSDGTNSVPADSFTQAATASKGEKIAITVSVIAVIAAIATFCYAQRYRKKVGELEAHFAARTQVEDEAKVDLD